MRIVCILLLEFDSGQQVNFHVGFQIVAPREFFLAYAANVNFALRFVSHGGQYVNPHVSFQMIRSREHSIAIRTFVHFRVDTVNVSQVTCHDESFCKTFVATFALKGSLPGVRSLVIFQMIFPYKQSTAKFARIRSESVVDAIFHVVDAHEMKIDSLEYFFRYPFVFQIVHDCL